MSFFLKPLGSNQSQNTTTFNWSEKKFINFKNFVKECADKNIEFQKFLFLLDKIPTLNTFLYFLKNDSNFTKCLLNHDEKQQYYIEDALKNVFIQNEINYDAIDENDFIKLVRYLTLFFEVIWSN